MRRFIVFGAGAVGGVIGARLAQHGHEVVLVARGAHADAIGREGLQLDTPGASEIVRVPVVTTPAAAAIGEDDVVVLAMKSQHTAEAVDALAGCAPPGVAVVCAQNGLENERAALRRFARVYAVVVQLPSAHLRPGVVMAMSAPVTGILDIGRYPEGVDETARTVATALSSARFVSVARPDVMRWKRAKLLANLQNAAPVVFGLDVDVAPLLARARAEGMSAFTAAGLDWTGEHEFEERHRHYVTRLEVAGYGRVGGSSWQSVQRSTGSVECAYLNGEISLIGRLHGVATPVNDLLVRLADDVATGRRPAGGTTMERFERMLATTTGP